MGLIVGAVTTIDTLRRSPAARTGMSIAVATGLYGVSFGALGVAAGLEIWQTCLLSVLMFTGGSQFALVGVVAGGGTPASAAGAATLLGIRNSVYAMQLKAILRPRGWKRFLMAHVTIDESTATAVAQQDPNEQRYGFWTAGLGIYAFWNLSTLIGAVAGNALGDPQQWGLDGAAVAAFLALLWPRLRDRDAWAVAVVSALVTAVMIPLVPVGLPILVAAGVAAAIGWAGRDPLRPETA